MPAAPDAAHIEALLARENTDAHPGLLRDFQAARCAPRDVTVQFSGGHRQTCWQITRSDGDYSVVFIPSAGCFSLCVDSAFGPLDIGVHGAAIDCFGSV